MTSALSEFVSAGFLITRAIPRPSYFSADLLPEQIVTASGCIANFIPDTWCIEWAQDAPEDQTEKAKAFNLDASGLSKVTAWASARFGDSIGWPNVLLDLHVAHQLVETFLSSVPDVKVLELALHTSQVLEFCQEAEPPSQENGFSTEGRQGIHEAVLKAGAV